ncbi:MMPL family transporter [Rugosimonospora africana]|uniref:Membrane protein n=1 Tax=Rugosimonospora africana TaxID=556532 RepID=A0A8J3VUA6_9ACTN|nr:MMPL family transporter [Rugosimonospora africana]GIH18789.1 membrane protein [Rugosimonospora africana]
MNVPTHPPIDKHTAAGGGSRTGPGHTGPSRTGPGSALGRLARVCYRRRWLVLPLWIVGAAAVLFVGFRFAAAADNDFSGGGSGSGRAQAVLEQHFPGETGDTLTLAVRADAGVRDPSVRPRVQAMLDRLGQAPDLSVAGSPYDVPGQISTDGRTAFATVRSTQTEIPVSTTEDLMAAARSASGQGVTFALGGDSVTTVETPYGGPSEGFGALAAMIVILISFGSLLAMGLPLLTALFGIGTGLAGVELLGHLLPAPSFTPVVSSLIGLGVGIDYALFIVTRYRESLHDGADPEEATVTAISTAGRSVLFAGSTVVIAMMGLFVMQQKLLNATAVAASVTVLMTMVTAITLLPALLGFTGRNIDRLRLPYLGRTATRSPLAERWARTIQRRPITGLVVGAVVMLTLAVPALSMRLSFEDSSTAPHTTMAYTSHRLLSQGFGAGYDAPLVVVADLPAGGAAAGNGANPGGGSDQPDRSALAPVARAVAGTAGVAAVTPVRTSTDGQAAEFIAFPATGTQDAATPALVHRLRDTVIPRASAGTGLRVYVGGPNAGIIDFADAVSTRLPWLVAVVIGLSLLLLLVLVRSVVIAVKAALMTLLSTGAAYGVLTAVVQWGWLGHVLGFPQGMPITTWVPLFIFPILFGLSTDYEVFLISRIREEYDAGHSTAEAVARGLSHTARVITAAAAIMVLVFLTVLLGNDMAVKQFGLGLAVAVLLDATVVRMVLVPALMELLGAANWWLPRWLARLLPSA